MAGTSVERTSDQAPSHSEIAVPAHHPRPVYNPDAPSEAWGWHGQWREFAPRGRAILLGIAALMMFLMTIGNHESHVEDYWLVAIGTAMVIWIIASQVSYNKRRRRR